MKNLRMFILLLLYGLFTSVQDVMGENVPQHEIKRVLFVSSYDSEQVWGRKVLNGVTKQLNKTWEYPELGPSINLKVPLSFDRMLT